MAMEEQPMDHHGTTTHPVPDGRRPWAIPALADWAVRRHPQSHGGAEGGEADTSAGWAHRTLVLRGSISGRYESCGG